MLSEEGVSVSGIHNESNSPNSTIDTLTKDVGENEYEGPLIHKHKQSKEALPSDPLERMLFEMRKSQQVKKPTVDVDVSSTPSSEVDGQPTTTPNISSSNDKPHFVNYVSHSRPIQQALPITLTVAVQFPQPVITQYAISKHKDMTNFINGVVQALNEGWYCHGTMQYIEGQYTQVMVKY